LLKRLLKSFNYAIGGIMHCFRTQRNMRFHFVMAMIAVALGVFLNITKTEMLILVLTIFFVIFAEMVNTTVEALVDMVTKEYHPLAKIAKNIAAGAVLMAALCSVIVGYLLFFEKLLRFSSFSLNYMRSLPLYITLASLVVVFLTVVMLKAGNPKKGTYVRGGLPSGHTALAFALFTSIAFASKEPITTTFGAIMALLVAESRMESGIHSFMEVLLGAVIGVLLTVVMYQASSLLLA